MIRKPIHPIMRIVLGIVSICVIVGGYSLLSARQKRANPNDRTIPNASQFMEGLRLITKLEPDEAEANERRTRMLQAKLAAEQVDSYEQLSSSGKRDIEDSAKRTSWVVEDAKASLWRLVIGITSGCALAFLVGIAMGCFTWIEALLLPPISFLAKIPPTAMVVVYMIMFGLGIKLFVALIAIGIFPTLAQSIYQAAKKDVSEHAIYKAYTLGASQFEVIWEVVIPQILPRIIEAIRLQIGPAMIFLIAAELLYADTGFGYRLRVQPRMFNYNVIFIYLTLLGCFGMVVDWVLSTFRRWFCPWFGE